MVDFSQIKGITNDSRKVKPGYLFAALPGSQVDGRDYIEAAIAKGASAILTTSLHGHSQNESVQSNQNEMDHTHSQGEACNDGVSYIYADNPRLKYAQIAAQFYGAQPSTCIAVTGTNGKTSVVSFAEQLWALSNIKGESLGTLKGNLTTPDAGALHEKLKNIAGNGITHLALEASSHGLDQYRLHGANLKAAGFTNLTRDHLDYHGDMNSYFAAKAKLFSEVLPEGGTAVLNADIEEFEELKNICHQRGQKVIAYGHKGSDLNILSRTATPHGQDVVLEMNGQGHEIHFPLVGEFQLMNALCAFALSGAEDLKLLERLKPAKGRLENITGHPNAGIYVDYAHTPDALETVLKALRPHTKNKLVCVFGCGGDRDTGKRPQMGAVASTLADTVIVTDDNPRSESPGAIRKDILAAAPNALEIAGRREAITQAIQNLKAGDVLVIAGKGHETGQIFADHTEDFDDVQEAQKAIQNL